MPDAAGGTPTLPGTHHRRGDEDFHGKTGGRPPPGEATARFPLGGRHVATHVLPRWRASFQSGAALPHSKTPASRKGGHAHRATKFQVTKADPNGVWERVSKPRRHPERRLVRLGEPSRSEGSLTVKGGGGGRDGARLSPVRLRPFPSAMAAQSHRRLADSSLPSIPARQLARPPTPAVPLRLLGPPGMAFSMTPSFASLFRSTDLKSYYDSLSTSRRVYGHPWLKTDHSGD